MRYIDNNCIDPYFNLALEEYLLRNQNDEYFVLWRDEPCIVVGKNQNTLSEINEEYIKKNKIKVVRRQSGGGAVFHDLGNLNFTFIVEDDGKKFNNFKIFIIPIIGVLKELGIKAKFSGRNDLLIEGKKFSGNAQCKHGSRVMHHGTLLFSSDIINLSDALISKPIKFLGKAVKSVSSRITNINEYLKEPLNVINFKDKIFEYIIRTEKDMAITTLNKQETLEVENLVKTKYETWQWNFGNSPKYNFYNEKKFSCGSIELSIDVEKGVMKDIRIFGDFFGEENIEDIEKALTDKKHVIQEIDSVLDNINIKKYFGNLTKQELLSLFF